MSFLSVLEAPFKFVGKAFTEVSEWLPKIVGIAAFSEQESKVLTPALVAVVKDVEDLAVLVTHDGLAAFNAIEGIIASIAELGGAGALDPAHYAKVITNVNAFIADIHGNPDWTALFPAIKKVIADFDALGSEAKSALERVGSIVNPALAN